MTIYRIEFASSKVTNDLDKIPIASRKRIIAKLYGLNDYPNVPNTRKLQGYQNIHRLRFGNYRIVFEVLTDQSTIVILLIKHRKDIYQKLRKTF